MGILNIKKTQINKKFSNKTNENSINIDNYPAYYFKHIC